MRSAQFKFKLSNYQIILQYLLCSAQFKSSNHQTFKFSNHQINKSTNQQINKYLAPESVMGISPVPFRSWFKIAIA